jgi:hypothetical protein
VESLRMRQRGGRSSWLALFPGLVTQETPSGVRYDYLCAASGRCFAFHQSAVHGVFPYCETRARRAPGVDDLGIGAGLAADPFDEVENQCFRRDTGCRVRFRIMVGQAANSGDA